MKAPINRIIHNLNPEKLKALIVLEKPEWEKLGYILEAVSLSSDGTAAALLFATRMPHPFCSGDPAMMCSLCKQDFHVVYLHPVGGIVWRLCFACWMTELRRAATQDELTRE
jgi:hypothetical protein